MHERLKPSEKITFTEVAEIFAGLTGQESAATLNGFADKINNYYASLTPANMMQEKQTYNPPDRFYPLGLNTSIPFSEIHRQLREGELSKLEQKELKKLLYKNDVFEPLFRTVTQAFQQADLDQAGSLIYLCYQIDNPYKGPTLQAKSITRESQRLFESAHPEQTTDQIVADRIIEIVDELVLTSLSWKSAWSYFSPYRARQLLQMLQSEKYGSKLFADLRYFAEQGKLVCPPQFFSFFKQLETTSPDNYISALKDLYDQNGSLKTLAQQSDFNYQVSGLQRAHEYPLEKIEEWLRQNPQAKDQAILSLGGCLGLIEIERQKSWGLKGPIVIVDQASREESLAQSLVLENELVFKQGDPCLTTEQIQKTWQECPVDLKFITARLPLSPQQIRQEFGQAGIDQQQKIGIIFDQRASALYLRDKELLASIRASLNILEDQGFYFLTKGYANKLFVDLVVQKKSDKTNLLLLHHTNSFFGQEANGLIRLPLTAELGRRIDGDLNPILFQSERQSQDFLIQQQLRFIKDIADRFSEQNLCLIYDLEGITFTRYLVYAYAAYLGMPLVTFEEIPENRFSDYTKIIDKLVQAIKLAEKNPDLLAKTSFEIQEDLEGFALCTRAVNRFLSEVKKKPQILIQALDDLKKLFEQNPWPEFYFHQQLVHVADFQPNSPPSPEEIEAKHSLRKIRQGFRKQFDYRFFLPDTGFHTSVVVFDAILSLYNLLPPVDQVLKLDNYDPQRKKEVLEIYDLIIEQIKRKLKVVSLGQDCKFDFPEPAEDVFWSITQVLNYTPDETWQKVNQFIDTHFKTRSLQAAAGC